MRKAGLKDWVRFRKVNGKGRQVERKTKKKKKGHEEDRFFMKTLRSAFWGFLPGAGSYFSAATANAVIQIKDTTVLKTATKAASRIQEVIEIVQLWASHCSLYL